MGNFVGKGYSKEFAENMKRVISALEGGERFILTKGEDDICKACPFDNKGVCRDISKVSVYDEKVRKLFDIEYGKEYDYDKIKGTANGLIYARGGLNEICGDCEWFELCISLDKNHVQ